MRAQEYEGESEKHKHQMASLEKMMAEAEETLDFLKSYALVRAQKDWEESGKPKHQMAPLEKMNAKTKEMFDFLKSYASFAKKVDWKPGLEWHFARDTRFFNDDVKKALKTIQNTMQSMEAEQEEEKQEEPQTLIRNTLDQRKKPLLAAYEKMKTALEDVRKLEKILAAEKTHAQAMLAALQSNPDKEEEAKKFAISMKEKLKLGLQVLKKKQVRLNKIKENLLTKHINPQAGLLNVLTEYNEHNLETLREEKRALSENVLSAFKTWREENKGLSKEEQREELTRRNEEATGPIREKMKPIQAQLDRLDQKRAELQEMLDETLEKKKGDATEKSQA
ncbi:hypothetical protein EIL50_04560 [bacterium NHP-B]|nr:hypothetical protein EIL50_04560 [bacterium NHP-B]